MRLPLPAQMLWKTAAFRVAGPILAPLVHLYCQTISRELAIVV